MAMIFGSILKKPENSLKPAKHLVWKPVIAKCRTIEYTEMGGGCYELGPETIHAMADGSPAPNENKNVISWKQWVARRKAREAHPTARPSRPSFFPDVGIHDNGRPKSGSAPIFGYRGMGSNPGPARATGCAQTASHSHSASNQPGPSDGQPGAGPMDICTSDSDESDTESSPPKQRRI